MLAPIAVISIIAVALLAGDGGPRLAVAIVDEDGGPVAQAFKTALADHADLVTLGRDDAVRFVRDRNRGPAAVIFPAGMSENYRRGRPSELLLLTDPAQEAGLGALKVLLLLMEKKAAALEDPFAEQMIVLKERSLTGNRLAVSAFEQNLPGFSLMFVLIAVIFGTSLGLHDERDWGTLPRLLVAPAGFTAMLIGKLGARVVLGVVQMAVLLLWSHFAFGVALGSSPLAVAALICAVVLATVATGLLVAGVTRTREQVQPLGLALVILLSGLGGLWWPQSMAPAWVSSVAPVAYTTWAMQGMNDLVLRNRGLAAVAVPVAAMTAYALLAAALGLVLFRARQGAR